MNIVPVIRGCARILLVGFSVSASLGVTRENDAAEVYVSVTGNAAADGSLEKPYGSLADAIEAVRALRNAGDAEPAVIVLREGRHQLDQTLVLGTDDGAPPDSKSVSLPKYGAGETLEPAYLTIAAYPGEHPLLSAGIPVTGWRLLEQTPPELPAQAAGKVWVTDLPAEVRKILHLV